MTAFARARACVHAKLGAFMSRTSVRRPLSDRITNVAACIGLAGLVLWYAGGSAAIDRTVHGATLFIPVAILSLIGAVIALVKEPKLDKAAFGTAAFLALGLVLLGFDLAALVNRHASGSMARTGRAGRRADLLPGQAERSRSRSVSAGACAPRWS